MIGSASLQARTRRMDGGERVPSPPRFEMEDAELGERVLGALRESGRQPLKVVSVVADRFGHVVLSGDLSTYFLKQAAQTIVARVPGVVEVDNAIRVNGEPCLTADGPTGLSAS